MIRVTWQDPADAVDVLDALHERADREQTDRPLKAKRLRRLADELDDAITDACRQQIAPRRP